MELVKKKLNKGKTEAKPAEAETTTDAAAAPAAADATATEAPVATDATATATAPDAAPGTSSSALLHTKNALCDGLS